MALSDKKITNYKDGVNVETLPDYPSAEGYSADTLKKIFYGRTNDEIKNAINGIIDELLSNTAAGQILCEDGKSIEEKLKEGLSVTDKNRLTVAFEHTYNKNNPHEVKASQVETNNGLSVEEKLSQNNRDIAGVDDRVKILEETSEPELYAEGMWKGLRARMFVYPDVPSGKVLFRLECYRQSTDEWIVEYKAELLDSYNNASNNTPKDFALLNDAETGKVYKLYVSNGKLMMQESEEKIWQ